MLRMQSESPNWSAFWVCSIRRCASIRPQSKNEWSQAITNDHVWSDSSSKSNLSSLSAPSKLHSGLKMLKPVTSRDRSQVEVCKYLHCPCKNQVYLTAGWCSVYRVHIAKAFRSLQGVYTYITWASYEMSRIHVRYHTCAGHRSSDEAVYMYNVSWAGIFREYIYIYIYMYVYVIGNICTYVHMYICIYVNVNMYVYIYMCVRVNIFIYIYICV